MKRGREYIGRDTWDEDSYFDGKIDEVMVWSRALSAVEIKQLYDVTK